MDRARKQFDGLTAEGDPEERWKCVQQLVDDQVPESLWLDFKEVSPAAKPSEEYIKEKLARALSGFANTEGGVLVYGITAKGGKKGQADVAEKVVALDDARTFAAALEKVASSVVDPYIGGVIVEPVLEPGSSRGVVAVFVPESLGAPHRTVSTPVASNERYFMRTTTEHVVMPHRLLADRFARSASPRLQLTARVVDHLAGRVELRLANLGRGSARRPAISFAPDPTTTMLDVSLNSKLTNGLVFHLRPSSGNAPEFLLEPYEDVVIYPAMHLSAGFITVKGGGSFTAKLRITLHALDAQPIEGHLDIGIIRHVPPEIVNGREYEMHID